VRHSLQNPVIEKMAAQGLSGINGVGLSCIIFAVLLKLPIKYAKLKHEVCDTRSKVSNQLIRRHSNDMIKIIFFWLCLATKFIIFNRPIHYHQIPNYRDKVSLILLFMAGILLFTIILCAQSGPGP